jgi:hypothetical protein
VVDEENTPTRQVCLDIDNRHLGDVFVADLVVTWILSRLLLDHRGSRVPMSTLLHVVTRVRTGIAYTNMHHTYQLLLELRPEGLELILNVSMGRPIITLMFVESALQRVELSLPLFLLLLHTAR